MARHKSLPHSRLEVSIPEALRLQVELFLRRDPLTGKIALGEWSNYVTRLMEEDLSKRARIAEIPGV